MANKPTDEEIDSWFEPIDQDKLDSDLAVQSGRMKLCCDWLASLKYDLKEAEDNLEVVKSETAFAIRKKPENFGVTKVTDAMVKELIPLQKAFQDATHTVNKAKRRVDRVQGAVNSLENRKRNLEKLVDLHGQGYWSAPRARVYQAVVEEAGKLKTRKPTRREDVT